MSTIATTVRRYQGKIHRFRRNRMFQNSQRQFYRELNQEVKVCEETSCLKIEKISCGMFASGAYSRPVVE